MKTCSGCKLCKALDEFGKNKNSKDGLNWYCKKCSINNTKKYLNKDRVKAYAKKRYHENKERLLKANEEWRLKNKVRRKDYKLKSRYGISLEDYNNMLTQQNGSCKICNRNKELVVDHCHKTGKVRGLLCGKCNKGLGHFFDNKDYLKQAINYLGENNGN